VRIATFFSDEVVAVGVTSFEVVGGFAPAIRPASEAIDDLSDVVSVEFEDMERAHDGLIHLARFRAMGKCKSQKRTSLDHKKPPTCAMPKAPSVKWTREHFLIALNLYGKLPFGKLHKGNPLIIEVAEKMGRTPSSLAMKLGNFSSLDPVLQARGIKGLAGATKQDRFMWAEFRGHLDTLAPESEMLLHDLFTTDDAQEVDFLGRDRVRLVPPLGPTEKLATVKQRRGQQFFRQTLLNAYGVRCCISGINVPRFLVASHIRPWSQFPEDRLNPRNGLCLSMLHDAAFDSGLITLDEKLRVVLSPKLKRHFPQPALQQNFAAYEGASINLPEMLAEPDPEFLAHHRTVIFQADSG
jgi:hypothetical protein